MGVAMSMRLLLVTSCTGSKAVTHPGRLTRDDFRDPARLAAREGELAEALLPAAGMYTGQQHVQAMRGAERLRARFGRDAAADGEKRRQGDKETRRLGDWETEAAYSRWRATSNEL